MATQETNITSLVDEVRKKLRSYKLIFSVLLVVAITSFVLVVLAKLTSHFQLREEQSFALTCFTLLPAAIWLFKAIKDYFQKFVSRQDVALKIEESTPDLMDSYVCAMEISAKGGPSGVIEKALLDKVSTKFSSGEIQKIVTPSFLRPSNLAFLAIVTLALGVMLGGNPLISDSFGFLKFKGTGVATGLNVSPGDVNVAKGSDLTIVAEVTKGDQVATLEYEQEGRWLQLAMIPEEGKLTAVIYGIEGDFKYRVITPKFSSSTYTVSTYLEPEIESVEFVVTPPKYTGKPSFTVKDFKSFAVPEKSIVELKSTFNKDVKAVLTQDGSDVYTSSNFSSEMSFEVSFEKSVKLQLSIIDDADNKAQTEEVKVNVVKDMPPHVEISKPAKDLKKTIFDIVNLEISALDDYGLTEVNLHLEYSFGSSEVIQLFKGDSNSSSKEQSLFQDLNIKQLGLKEGDVVTYYVEASDNAQPTNQKSKTKIYFLEVHPDKSDTEKKEEEESEGQETQLSVNDLIATQKDLIRHFIDVKSSLEIGKDGKANIASAEKQALSTETATLRLEVQKRKDKLEEEAKKMGADLGVIGEYFTKSIESLKKGEGLLSESFLVKAMQENSKSLSELIKIQIELEKNSQKSQSKSQQEQKPQEEQQQQEQEQERLADMLKKLEDLEDQQKELNDQMKEMKKDDLQEQEATKEKLQDQQERLEKTSESLQEQQQQQASEQLQQASQQMQQASQQMQQGESGQAQQSSQQAEQKIENAKNEIKRAMREQAREQLKQLADTLDKTVEQQQEIGSKTNELENPSSEESKKQLAGLKEEQDKVQEDLKKIIDQLGAAANELDEKYPEVAEALREAREYAGNQGIDRRLKRSSNALHYRRKSAAVREQQKAEEAMNMLGHKVRDAVGRLPQATLEELLKMRQDVEQVRRQVGSTSSGMSAGQVSERTSQIQKMIESMGETLQDENLQFALPESLEQAKSEISALNAAKSQMKALTQAAFILDSLISKADLEKRLTLNKRTGNAPDKYKRSVREYLRSLSDDKK